MIAWRHMYVAFAAAIYAASSAQAANWQAWLTQSVEVPISAHEKWGKLSASVAQDERLGGDGFAHFKTLTLMKWRVLNWAELAVGDAFICERPTNGNRFSTEQRPNLDITLSAPTFWMLRADWRSRFELRMPQDESAYLRYRARFRLRTTWSWSDFKLSPYASDELFFTDGAHTPSGGLLSRNRAQAGISFRLIPSVENLTCKLYYQLQHDQTADAWRPTQMAGLEIAYAF